jgi:hypothetical protein
MKIIGVAGKARTGKDTVGDYLIEEKGFIRLSFAGPLKRMVCALLYCDENWINDPDNKEFPVPGSDYSPRQLMQTLGTEWGRKTLGEDFWVNIVQRDLQALCDIDTGCGGVIITDCRFDNEAEMLRKMGGTIWHIIRNDAPKVATHASEAGISLHEDDYVLLNNSTIVGLYDAIDNLLGDI